jgi:hypothetical protein
MTMSLCKGWFIIYNKHNVKIQLNQEYDNCIAQSNGKLLSRYSQNMLPRIVIINYVLTVHICMQYI